ncbi:hypothetical protein C3941_24025 [Kaistia algarum]|uniref:hypothetical protein n=1 Tax=Kaistia algarum TaxID=2083279 RepID=UPI000CE85737|nr:hypothetical protein [Kaistia algarum]MCX5514250.1 hypothetical protein [Kaistia algarum]PPE77363.1 hypothetical protein C3941_24025 [Kaistia algarum]
MSTALSTRPIRDGVGNPFLQRVLDASGTGAGPFLPVQAIAGPEDGLPIDLAALFEALSGAVEAAADRVVASLAALPAPDAAFVPHGHQSVIVTSTAQTLAALLTAAGGAIAAIPAGTKLVYLQPRADGIRYAHGGTVPTLATDATGIGTVLFEGAQYPLRLGDFATLRLIAPSNTVLSIEFRG